jgi:hypothetical protein
LDEEQLPWDRRITARIIGIKARKTMAIKREYDFILWINMQI